MSHSVKLKKVRSVGAADGHAFNLHLFRGSNGICAWYLGPANLASDELSIPYLPRSAETPAPLAIVRAIEAAEAAKCKLCVIDPDDLWGSAWQAGC